jgi:hypothetical protein
MGPVYEVLTYFLTYVNEVTIFDIVKLIASFSSDTMEAFNCHKCLAKDNRKLREMKGCFKPDPLSDRVTVFRGIKIKYLKCVGNYRLSEWKELFYTYDYWKQSGNMPDGESFYDTPSKLLEVFFVIDSLVTEFREKNSNGKRSRSRN